jgi:hypothetical protein
VKSSTQENFGVQFGAVDPGPVEGCGDGGCPTENDEPVVVYMPGSDVEVVASDEGFRPV